MNRNLALHPKAKSLLEFLYTIPQKGILFGHQDALSYGYGWRYDEQPGACDVHRVCGDYPSVFGWDLGHLEIGSDVNIDGVSFALMREQIQRAHEMGGINTISWHPHNPITGGNTWDVEGRGVEKIIPGGSHEEIFKKWLTKIADFLLSLKTPAGEPIPLLFRPYHEHTGDWFWWGSAHCEIEEFKRLWISTIEFLRDEKGLHNLLYVYSTDKVTSEGEYLERYPGDEWIDILGIDVYDFPHLVVDYEKVLPECLGVLQKVGLEKKKPYALTETGNLCVQTENWWTDSLLRLSQDFGLSWFLVWINLEKEQYYGPHPASASADNFVEFYNRPQTIFLKEICSLRSF